jgi:hypothetical protein
MNATRAVEAATAAAVDAFDAAFASLDAEAAEDCVFENTSPPPAGQWHGPSVLRTRASDGSDVSPPDPGIRVVYQFVYRPAAAS